MQTVKMKAGQLPDGKLNEIVQVLDRGGVPCLPCNGTYRLFADVTNEEAVMRLIQTKRRVHKAPSLLFISSVSELHKVTDQVDPVASTLMKELWPAPLTIRFSASRDLPRNVVRELTKATGKLGVRVPQNRLSQKVVEGFGNPVYVSSANKGQKSGETSAAQVRHNFGRQIDLFVDNGDLNPVPSSTVIDVEDNQLDVVRSGAVSTEKIERVAGVA